jgi:hypothetical protein
MALRSFRTPGGVLCDVWEVTAASVPGPYATPRVRERRGQDLIRYAGPERRKAERRRTPPRASLLTPEYAGGWLTFEGGGEKRRLAPPPAGWADLPEERLVELWRRARPVTRGMDAPPHDLAPGR